ncbi:glycosyltransferase family 4 protein [Crocosphaera sp. UHCC 0190]|uniref:glycosyltransferase family 4 protein n=1 Tax=Crocosphaera sp. UHCC 0190 TaxID=3110246 RepID=UPI002B20E560|nr:glycosyltransferase family 4 protein [Crocosphaera sp. UHCC 0190]MEA5511116.1 glycosyltransferase family 4 protein [Crocosphaera sp. UHCC 0190]
MNNRRLKVLLIIEQCNPDWSSVPLLAYNFYQEISRFSDVTLVTHERNKKALEKHPEHQNIVYIYESKFSKIYHKIIATLTSIGRKNWPLYIALSYPIYGEFNQQVYQKFKDKVLEKEYDIVHVITPMMPRYPVKIINACQNTPFLLGPVNGGVPFPTGFQKVARQEFAYFNFLRAIGRYLIPGYVETYKKADKILAGSTYTLNLLKDLFAISDDKINLFYENGISQDFFKKQQVNADAQYINLLFVGRLVPYKGADMVIEAINNLAEEVKNKVKLTIVGDGSEKNILVDQVKNLRLENIVNFTGWVKQHETLEYYQNSDIFCFPSIREFGGAVVLEAMACGLPCIVANNGGIGEYVNQETGFSIDPKSREYLITELTDKITILVQNEQLRHQMSAKCYERVQEFEWSQKAKKIAQIYHELIASVEKKKKSLS